MDNEMYNPLNLFLFIQHVLPKEPEMTCREKKVTKYGVYVFCAYWEKKISLGSNLG